MAVGFAVGIVGGADPDRPCGVGLAAVVLAAVGAGDKPCKGGCFLRLAGSILFFSPLDFRLNGVKDFRRNDSFMGVRCMVAGQFPVVFSGNFRQVVFAEFCLEKEISGVSIVTENALHGALMEHTAALCNIAAFVQPLGDGGDALSSEVIGKNASDDLGFFRNNDQLIPSRR